MSEGNMPKEQIGPFEKKDFDVPKPAYKKIELGAGGILGELARVQAARFNREHVLREKLADGFRSAGRFLDLNSENKPVSSSTGGETFVDRAIFVVDSGEGALQGLIKSAQEAKSQAATQEEALQKVVNHIVDSIGPVDLQATRAKYEGVNAEKRAQEVSLSGIVASREGINCEIGSLVNKTVLDQAGIEGAEVSLRRGYLINPEGNKGLGTTKAHEWVEVSLNGKTYIVEAGSRRLVEVGSVDVSKYRQVSNPDEEIYPKHQETKEDYVDIRYKDGMVREGDKDYIVLTSEEGREVKFEIFVEGQGEMVQIDDSAEVVFQVPDLEARRQGEVKTEVFPGRDWLYVVETDAKTGERLCVYRQKEVHEEAGSIKNPRVEATLNPAQKEAYIRNWLEEILRSKEGQMNRDVAIKAETKNDLINTIDSLEYLDVDVRRELHNKAAARIDYHNFAKIARSGLAGIKEIIDLAPEEHGEILNTPGVREAINQMVANDGEYFRIHNTQATPNAVQNAKDAIVQHLINNVNLTAEQAAVAFELAEKSADMFGESAYYDGIVETNNPKIGTNGAFVQARDTAGQLLTDPKQIMEFFADYFINKSNRIDWNNSLKGQGAEDVRTMLYTPAAWHDRPDRGTHEELKKYFYEWKLSARQTFRRDSLTQLMEDLSHNTVGLKPWSTPLSIAHEKREILYNKGEDSVLNNPLITPHSIHGIPDPAERKKAYEAILKNYIAAEEAFVHIQYADKNMPTRDMAMANALRGIMKEARDRGIWSQGEVNEAIWWAEHDKSKITDAQRESLIKNLDISIFLAGLQIGGRHVPTGVFGTINRIIAAVTKLPGQK